MKVQGVYTSPDEHRGKLKLLASVTVGVVLLFPQMRPILYKDFEAALRIIKPSVSDRDLELYIDWNRQFGCGLNSHVD